MTGNAPAVRVDEGRLGQPHVPDAPVDPVHEPADRLLGAIALSGAEGTSDGPRSVVARGEHHAVEEILRGERLAWSKPHLGGV
jgi:hypothetical protein